MRTELKEGIFIEGFGIYRDWGTRMDVVDFDELRYELLYAGETSNIPEEVAKDCVIQNGLAKGTVLDDGKTLDKDITFGYKQYREGFGVYEYETAKQSIQSACDKQFCIIYKEVKP